MMMFITMTMISTIMRPMTMMTTTAELMSYLMMTRKILATMTTDMTIIFPGHHHSASKEGSNAPAVVNDNYENQSLDLHVPSNHGGLNGPSHDNPPLSPTKMTVTSPVS